MHETWAVAGAAEERRLDWDSGAFFVLETDELRLRGRYLAGTSAVVVNLEHGVDPRRVDHDQRGDELDAVGNPPAGKSTATACH